MIDLATLGDEDDGTVVGVGIPTRAPNRSAIRERLERGAFLASFDAGIVDVVDVAPRNVDAVCLVERR